MPNDKPVDSKGADNDLGYQLEQGLKQLQINIEFLRKTHSVRGLDLTAPYTINTENALKIEFANQALKGLSLSKANK